MLEDSRSGAGGCPPWPDLSAAGPPALLGVPGMKRVPRALGTGSGTSLLGGDSAKLWLSGDSAKPWLGAGRGVKSLMLPAVPWSVAGSGGSWAGADCSAHLRTRLARQPRWVVGAGL